MSRGRQLPSNLKHAPIKPKVKKANVDHFPKKISDLYPNISVKAFRKGVANQLTAPLERHNIYDKFQ